MTTGRLPAVIERERDDVVDRFLEIVRTTGNSSGAARSVGLSRQAFYERAVRDPDFREEWEHAQRQSRSHIAQEIMDKAVVLTGRVVEEPLLDSQGNQVLDDNLEAIVIRRVVDYDARILSKLLDKLLASEDGAPVTAVQVNLPPPPPPPPAPPRVARLVFADARPDDSVPSVAEAIQDATWEPVQ